MFATIARFCAGHRRGVLAAWILLILVGGAASLPLIKHHLTNPAGASSESARGASILDRAYYRLFEDSLRAAGAE